LLNDAEHADARLLLYRFFWIRAIVSLPRNLFVDTPTLTSLLFAQKKTGAEIAAWDAEWRAAELATGRQVAGFQRFLTGARRDGVASPAEVEAEFLSQLDGIVDRHSFVVRRGGRGATSMLPAKLPPAVTDLAGALDHYQRMLDCAGFRLLRRGEVLRRVARKLDYDYAVYAVDKVGYKLSRRPERSPANELCAFVDDDGREVRNLRKADGRIRVRIDTANPTRVLDFIRRDVRWT
jgi:type I restriction enzyme M protein